MREVSGLSVADQWKLPYQPNAVLAQRSQLRVWNRVVRIRRHIGGRVGRTTILESRGAPDCLLKFGPGKQVSQAGLEKIRLSLLHGGCC